MFKKILLFFILTLVYNIEAKDFNDILITLNNNKFYFDLNQIDYLSNLNNANYKSCKIDCGNYDLMDFRASFKKNFGEHEINIANFLNLPVSNKGKEYFNNLLFYTQSASIGLKIDSTFHINRKNDNNLNWNNIFEMKYETQKNESRKINLINKERFSKIFTDATNDQIDQIFSLISVFSKEVEILNGITYNFTTSITYKNAVWNAELGYNLFGKNKEYVKFSDAHLEELKFFDLNNVLSETIDLKEYKELIRSNNINIKLEDLDYSSKVSNIKNKIYLILGRNFKLADKVINLNLNLSYTMMPNNKDDINILTTISSIF